MRLDEATAGAPSRPLTSADERTAPAKRATPIGAAAVLGTIVAFSLLNLVVKISHASATTFAFYRLWLGALGMVLTSALRRSFPGWRAIRRSIPAGALFGLNIVLFFSALKRTAVADVLIIAALQPALTLLVAGRLFGERPGAVDVAWTLVSVAGVILVTIGSAGTPVWSLAGDVFAVGSLLSFSIYFVISKHMRASLSALEYMTGVTITAAIVATPLAFVSGRTLRLRAVDWLWLLLFVLGAQGGHVVLAWAHAHVEVSVSSLLIVAEPVVSAVGALLVLGEPLTALEIAGGLVVLIGMAVVIRRATRAGVTVGDAPV